MGAEWLAAIAAIIGAGAGVYGATRKAPPVPVPEAPPAPPTIDDASKRQQEEDVMRRRRGRAATILTGAGGAGLPSTGAKTLLGA